MENYFLSSDQIGKLDEQIDCLIPNLSLLGRSRDEALLHILLYYETRSSQVDNFAQIKSKHLAVQRVYRALNHSVIWIYKFCPVESKNERPQYNEEIFDEARVLFSHAEDYADLWAEMSKLYRGRNKCWIVDNDTFEFSPSSLLNEELDCTRIMVDRHKDPQTFEDTQLVTPEIVKYIHTRIFATWNGKLKLTYKFAPEVFSYLADTVSERSHHKWLMNPEWDLGGYTFEQVKIFWITLQTISLIHQIAVNYVRVEIRRKTLSLQIRNYDDWVDEISKRSNLSVETCALILDDLIYDEKLYHRPKKENSHVMYQPFFRLLNGEIGLSDRIVQISNIDRNIWSLATVMPKPTINELKNKKEGYWINEIRDFAKRLGLKSFPNIKFNSGEIDLLIIDEEINFGLVCELKWLTYSDDVKGVESNDRVILEKISQASKGTEWIKSNIDQLSQKTGLKKEILSQIDYKPIFILKESFGSGFIEETPVPVINQALFEVVLGEPLSQSIFMLWKIASSQSYLAKKDKHFKYSSAFIKWGQMRFKISCVEILKKWSPELDIELVPSE